MSVEIGCTNLIFGQDPDAMRLPIERPEWAKSAKVKFRHNHWAIMYCRTETGILSFYATIKNGKLTAGVPTGEGNQKQ